MVTVTVTDPPPTVVVTATPSTIASGSTSVLNWSSKNANSCSATGGWNGTEATAGSASTPALTSTTRFTLTCTGSGGTAAQSATVTVSAAAPVVSLTAAPASVSQGATTTLKWSSTQATSCIASGAWSGTLATSGAQTTGAIAAATTFTLSCTGAGGTTVQSVTVGVSPATGTATLSWVAPTKNTDGTPVTPLSGYHIYYGQAQSALNQSVAVSGGSTTTYEITGLANGTWYFSIAADAVDGTEGPQSTIGSTTI